MMSNRILISFLFCFLCFHLASEPKIKFLIDYAYVGEVKETDRNILLPVRYTNVGNSPLYLDEIKSNCPCLRSEFSTEGLEPGDTAMFTLIFNPLHVGDVYQSVRIYHNSDTEERAYETFKVIGKVCE